MITIRLPWPSRDLHSNARVHWATKARATKKARHDAAWAAQEAGLRNVGADALDVLIIFQPPDRRRRDLDGMLSASKALIDGVADVVGVDDSKWAITMRKDEPVPGGRVVFKVELRKDAVA